MNIGLAKKIMQDLAAQGVMDFCICAGARNSPFVVLASKAKSIRVYHFFEERSAAFFAVGRIQRDGRPVAVITTSGTAVAELLPAVIEAAYTSLPLVLVTADRPQRFRGTGAPQTIEQLGIFSRYVEHSLDIAKPDDLEKKLQTWSRQQPLHLNVCFDEPLIDEEVPELDFVSSFAASLATKKNLTHLPTEYLDQPLAIVSGLPEAQRPEVIRQLLRLNIPVYAEGLSGLRGCEELAPLLIQGGEKTVHQSFSLGHAKSVLRIGGVPTLRFWRDLEDKFSHLDVHSVSESRWTGLSRPVKHKIGFQALEAFQTRTDAGSISGATKEIFRLDQTRFEKLKALLHKYPYSEPALIKELSDKLEDQSVYLGNSMPVRQWDLVASTVKAPRRLSGNRGVNGIDGQVSTFLGWSGDAVAQAAKNENWALLGDLTVLYDLSALWIARKLPGVKARVVVINNGGGQIFKNIFHNEAFLNRHEIHFDKWAQMFGWSYQSWNSIPDSLAHLEAHAVIEIFPQEAQTDSFWKEYQSL